MAHSRRAAALEPVEERAHNQCHRTPARGVQAQDQNPDHPALGRKRRDAVLGAARWGQIQMRRVDGWQSIATPCTDQPVALAA